MKYFAASALLILTSCAPRPVETPLTQMEIRAIQTREFETSDLKLVMKTMMHVLQDDGYIIKNAVLDLGLLCAEKQANVEDKTQAFLAACASGDKARWCKQKIMEASANVSEFGSCTRVRMNFQVKTYDNAGALMDIMDVKDMAVYQEFFAKVYKSIFIQSEGI